MEQGILEALRDEPDDPFHHLVFADWLDDQGHTSRAEYIRAWWRSTEVERAGLIARSTQQARDWLGPDGALVRNPIWHGAILARLEYGLNVPLPTIAAHLARHAIREVALWRLPSSYELSQWPEFGHIRELILGTGPQYDFFLWPALPPVRRLAFYGSIDNSFARLLAVTRRLNDVRCLAGTGNDLDDSGVVALLRSPHLANLNQWELHSSRITPLSLLHLFRGGRARRWHSLHYNLQDARLNDILPIGTCENLRRLSLTIPIVLDGQNPLECLEPLCRLRELTLDRVGPLAIEQLSRWPRLHSLERLKLRGEYSLAEEDVRCLLESPYRNPQTHLDIPGVVA